MISTIVQPLDKSSTSPLQPDRFGRYRQAFTCPLCGSPVIAFEQSYAPFQIPAKTFMNCTGQTCKGATTLMPDNWLRVVGLSELPAPLIVGQSS